jgi:hypothetical protein
MREHPRRQDGVQLEEVADGFLIHQPEKKRVHYLNRTAALVLEMCDGETGKTEMAAALKELFDLTDPPLSEVEECLDSLRKQGLVR